jgi:hypothetical protein
MSIYRKIGPDSVNEIYSIAVPPEAAEPGTPKTSEDPEKARLRRGEPMNSPLPRTLTWVAKLPRDLRPAELLRSYSRVANLIASIWDDPPAMNAYFADLLHDRRGNRKGFPTAVMAELLALRRHYGGLHPEPTIAWGDVTRRK